MTQPRDLLRPPILDFSGYAARRRDLSFLKVEAQQVGLWRGGYAPFGISEIQYAGFKRELARALLAERVPPEQCDVRLQGSSVRFFSASHKTLPVDRDGLRDLFRAQRKRDADDYELDEIERRLWRVWATDGIFPIARPFDALWCLGVAREPSDLDVQISDDSLVARCLEHVESLGLLAPQVRVDNPGYGFIDKEITEAALPFLFSFGLRMTDRLNRKVSIALFPSEGPPDMSASGNMLSSHFRDDDWIVAFNKEQAADGQRNAAD